MTPPLLRNKSYTARSVFTAENLLREARRQKTMGDGSVPSVCVLDPDGDVVRHLQAAGRARKHPHWPCYHTDLFEADLGSVPSLDGTAAGAVGILPCAVGASFAVLVAEELFASGCELLLSVTSSGQIVQHGKPPYFVLIERALRDEGTSYHYLPPAEFAHLNPLLGERLKGAFDGSPIPVHAGGTWTTDAPFRETESAIAAARERGLLAVEMEAAALYAFAEARGKAVVCFAHVTNRMAVEEGDFEKGEADGSVDALRIVALAVKALYEVAKQP